MKLPQESYTKGYPQIVRSISELHWYLHICVHSPLKVFLLLFLLSLQTVTCLWNVLPDLGGKYTPLLLYARWSIMLKTSLPANERRRWWAFTANFSLKWKSLVEPSHFQGHCNNLDGRKKRILALYLASSHSPPHFPSPSPLCARACARTHAHSPSGLWK